MTSKQQCKHLLLWIAIANVPFINGWKCALYLYSDFNYAGEYGPYDVGYTAYNWNPNGYGLFPGVGTTIASSKLWAAGYSCHAELYEDACQPSTTFKWMSTGAHLVTSDPAIGNTRNTCRCVYVYAVATPNPTSAPSRVTLPPTSTSPTSPPSTSPISSCYDYNNETSADGNNEMRHFNEKHITNIENYFMNGTFVSEFNSSRDNYQHKLIECVGSNCVIQCNESASCLETQIEINIQNKTTLLLCGGDYSCPGVSVKTQSGSMANITIVCKGKYSCINMDIQVANISSFNLYCLQYGSCWDVNVTIDSNNNDTRHNDGIISCVSLHSCDHLVIATNSNQTQLIMHEHSDDVTLNNG
eukprot:605618_1